MNKAIIIGRLTNDVTQRFSANGTAIANYTLAVDRRFKKDGEPSADFINCVSFGKTAEFLEKYCGKGTKLAAEGSIRTSNYEKDGRKVYVTEVLVDSVEFVEKKKEQNVLAEEPNRDEFVKVPDTVDEELPW